MFCPISMYPNYIINDNGVIISRNTNEEMKTEIIKGGYLRIQLSNGKLKHIVVHRLVYQHFGKDWNPELTVDHIDGNPQNNHISNLRMATQQEQNFNTKLRKSKLGIKGVCKKGDKYRAEIRINGEKTYLGTFDTLEEASNAYHTKAKELHGEFYRVG